MFLSLVFNIWGKRHMEEAEALDRTAWRVVFWPKPRPGTRTRDGPGPRLRRVQERRWIHQPSKWRCAATRTPEPDKKPTRVLVCPSSRCEPTRERRASPSQRRRPTPPTADDCRHLTGGLRTSCSWPPSALHHPVRGSGVGRSARGRSE